MDKINLTTDQKDITIREGKALPLEPPRIFNFSGDIKTLSNYLGVRISNGSGLQQIDKSKSVIIVDKNNLTITLHVDPENFYGWEIKGTLEKADELKPFFINENKTFTKEELVKLIKFNKLHFSDQSKHAEMLLAFQKVQSVVNIKANDSSDDRGNKERAFVKEVTSNAPTEFILDMPIFKGFGNAFMQIIYYFNELIILAKVDVLKRLLYILKEMHEKGVSKWLFIFETQLNSLDEINEIVNTK